MTLLMLLWACATGPATLGPAVTGPAVPPPATQENDMSASPEESEHPGIVVFDDQVRGTVEEKNAADLPETIAWFYSDGERVPVTRIQITGNDSMMRMTSFGADGQMLESTTRVR